MGRIAVDIDHQDVNRTSRKTHPRQRVPHGGAALGRRELLERHSL